MLRPSEFKIGIWTMKSIFAISILCAVLALFYPIYSHASDKQLILRENLKRALPGDYLVTAQNKNYTILLIRSKDAEHLHIEEITVPTSRISQKTSWRQWLENGAIGNTCWVMHVIHLPNANIQQTFSFTKNTWITISQSQNFLSTLLNLSLHFIPDGERKKIGPPPSSDSLDRRSIWQPALVVEGKVLSGVSFDAWRTRWPKDSSELSGRIIEVYTPKENGKYPSYFPYWLQISGMIGKAKVRIVDSGSQLFSSAKLPE